MKTNHTNEQLQAAIDEAFPKGRTEDIRLLDLSPASPYWDEEAPNRLVIIKSALATLPEPMDEESMLLNLLAVIHRDGGHYQAEHGTRKAVADACKEWQRLISIAEKTVLTEPKQSLSQLRPITEAGAVPEGCVRYYIYKKDGEWTTATKHRAMQDTHFADIRLPVPAEKPNPKPVEPLVTKPILSTSWYLRVGDVVTLKSGGPKMTVRQDMGNELLCAYDSLGEIKTVSIPTNCLQPA